MNEFCTFTLFFWAVIPPAAPHGGVSDQSLSLFTLFLLLVPYFLLACRCGPPSSLLLGFPHLSPCSALISVWMREERLITLTDRMRLSAKLNRTSMSGRVLRKEDEWMKGCMLLGGPGPCRRHPAGNLEVITGYDDVII